MSGSGPPRTPTTGRPSSPRSAHAHPGFLFLAEAYWDLEWALQQQGFDFCYDKRLYDRLAAADRPSEVRGSPDRGPAAIREQLVRFVENHDEPRAAAAFGTAGDRWPRSPR